MEKILSFDIGGTRIKYAVFDYDLKIIEQNIADTPSGGSYDSTC